MSKKPRRLKVGIHETVTHLTDNSRLGLSLQLCGGERVAIVSIVLANWPSGRSRSRSLNVLKVASITEISVAVVSNPAKAHQSLTTSPAPITSDPRFTVPACQGDAVVVSRNVRESARTHLLTTSGTWRSEESSSCSEREVLGCTSPPYEYRELSSQTNVFLDRVQIRLDSPGYSAHSNFRPTRCSPPSA